MSEVLDSSLPAKPLLAALVRHYGELVNYVRNRFGSHGFAQDVVHDVCVRLAERAAPEPMSAPLALLRRMAHDTAVDQCRADDARRRWMDSVATLPETAAPLPDHARRVDAQRDLLRLVEAIRGMPPRRRHVFVLHKIHEMPQVEVAARMGITVKMVEKHLRVALATCRAQLGRE